MEEHMEQQLTAVWKDAWASYHSELTVEERTRLGRIGSMEELMSKVQNLQQDYHNPSRRSLSTMLSRAEPFINHLRSFSQIINIHVSSHPEIAALVWGSVALVLELAARHISTMEHIVKTFEEIQRALPRFRIYLEEFSPDTTTTALRHAVVQLYTEIIKQCHEFIRFLKTPAIRNIFLFGKASRELSRNSACRLERIRQLTEWVDNEAHVIGLTMIKELLDRVKQPQIQTKTGSYVSVPFVHNPSFFDRPRELKLLESHLASAPSFPRIQCAVLVGAGGHGKTQIAAEYTHRNANDYDIILWCDAESDGKLAASYSMHAKALGLVASECTVGPDQLRSIVKQWLLTCNRGNNRTRWLVVMDNAEDPEIIYPFWPIGASGSIIITTRNPNLARRYSAIHIDIGVFNSEDSAKFLLAMAPTEMGCAASNEDEEKQAIEQITKNSGNLPLVLDLIRHYVLSSEINYTQFLRSYHVLERQLLTQQRRTASDAGTYHLPAVAGLTCGIPVMAEGARELIGVLAFLDPDNIQLDLFSITTDMMLQFGPCEPDEVPHLKDWVQESLSDQENLNEAVRELLSGSLIQRQPGGNSIKIHRITQRAYICTVDLKEKCRLFNHVVLRLNAAFPSQNDSCSFYQYWDACERYVHHVVAIVDHYEEHKAELGFPVTLSELIRRCSWYLFERHQFRQATQILKTALSICEDALCSTAKTGYASDWYMPRLISDLYTQLGSFAYENNMEGHGTEFHLKAMEIRKSVYDTYKDEFDAEQLRVYNTNYAVALMAEGHAPWALAILEETYKKAKLEGCLSGDGTNLVQNLALCQQIIGRFEDAVTTIEEALFLVKDSFGDNSLQMASTQFYFGRVLFSTGDVGSAFEAYTRCFETRQRLMPNHPETAFVCHKLALLAEDQKELSIAKVFFEEALRILADVDLLPITALRSAVCLQRTLKAIGEQSEADKLNARVEGALCIHGLQAAASRAGHADKFFDELILYKFR